MRKRSFNFFLTSALALIFTFNLTITALSQEELTLTTYYPAPYGVYNQLVTQTFGVGDNDPTPQPGLDSNDAPDPDTNPGDVWIAGEVGIGIGAVSPQEKLEIGGAIKIANTNANCNAATPNDEGIIRYNTGTDKVEYCDGTQWRSAFETACPAGFVDTGFGYCIQINENSATSFDGAAAYCATNFGARLCTHSEWYNGCVNSAAFGLINMTNNWEWVDDFVGGAAGCAYQRGSGGCGQKTWVNCFSSNAFHCCRSK
ncbi:MAG: hypothetical protein JSW40_02080 [Candidatus Omnitrophota bacterium]|nr:MAG: hypothetical protein JSW40_02080 [Candidatus Omnitrophota bacterium]